MKIKVFDSYVDFYNFINDYEITTLTPSFQPFIEAYDAINKGCGCRRKNRLQVALDRYRDVISLLQVDADILENIKVLGQYAEIQMYHEGVLLYKG